MLWHAARKHGAVLQINEGVAGRWGWLAWRERALVQLQDKNNPA
jgi:hypothetical protein